MIKQILSLLFTFIFSINLFAESHDIHREISDMQLEIQKIKLLDARDERENKLEKLEKDIKELEEKFNQNNIDKKTKGLIKKITTAENTLNTLNKDRRLTANQNPNKRCIVVIRQRHNEGTEFIGSVRTLTYVLHNENPRDIMNIANNRIELGTEVHADEANAYDNLHARFDMRRVNHSVEYMSEEGACSNQAESFFARFRRFQHGQIHRMGQLYISNYANEIAYREDTRRMDNGSIFRDITSKCMKTLQSNEWTGYWQGNHRISERLGVA